MNKFEEKRLAIEYVKNLADSMEHQDMVLPKLAITEVRHLIRRCELGEFDWEEWLNVYPK